jgi:hypothetical protein
MFGEPPHLGGFLPSNTSNFAAPCGMLRSKGKGFLSRLAAWRARSKRAPFDIGA